MLKVFWTRSVTNLLKVHKLHVLFFVLDSTLSFVVRFNFVLNKFNFLCLLVVSVERKLVMRDLVVKEIQGWNHHIVVCMICAVLVAII